MTFARAYVLLLGIAFITAGISGFIPALTTPPDVSAPDLIIDTSYGYLLGLFPVNIIHNLFHLIAGMYGIWATQQQTSALIYCRVIGSILLGFTIMGLLPQLSNTLGLMPLFGHDVWLHGLEALIALYLGFIATDKIHHIASRGESS